MSRSSKRWVREHRKDPYVQKARQAKYRARSAYKLLQMLERFPLLRPGEAVVDLGAAPGGWSQVAAKRVGPAGRVLAVDRLAMAPIPGVDVLQGDIGEAATVESIMEALSGRRADLLLSDMAPNTSGVASLDHDQSMALAHGVLDLAARLLRPGGSLVLKVFQGGDLPGLEREMACRFKTARTWKPPASRARSVEVYLVGLGFTGSPGSKGQTMG